MRLTPDQLKLLVNVWTDKRVDILSNVSATVSTGYCAGVLERMGFIHRVGSGIGVPRSRPALDLRIDGGTQSPSVTTYEITQKGIERLLDPESLLTREVLER